MSRETVHIGRGDTVQFWSMKCTVIGTNGERFRLGVLDKLGPAIIDDARAEEVTLLEKAKPRLPRQH